MDACGLETHPAARGQPVGLYIYFKSRADSDAVVRALCATDRLLRDGGWPPATLWHKPAESAQRTWMTVHPPQPAARIDALLSAFDAAAHATGLDALIDGTRHAERFAPCPPV